jgi:hypothetical protein
MNRWVIPRVNANVVDAISVEEQHILDGVTFCDYCYLEVTNPVKACNPLVVYSAKHFQEQGGPEAVAMLNEQQRAIYEFIKSRGKATSQEIMNHFNLSEVGVTNKFAFLRHLGLTKGKKEGKNVYSSFLAIHEFRVCNLPFLGRAYTLEGWASLLVG